MRDNISFKPGAKHDTNHIVDAHVLRLHLEVLIQESDLCRVWQPVALAVHDVHCEHKALLVSRSMELIFEVYIPSSLHSFKRYICIYKFTLIYIYIHTYICEV